MAKHDPIGLVGLGLVGNALARRLIAAGWRVVGCDLDARAGAAAAGLGVELVGEPAAVAEACRVVFLSLTDSAAVAEVLWGRGGLGACAPGRVVIDTTTAAPGQTLRHAERLAERGVRFVDAPLVGSSAEIAAGEGVAIVGDREEAADYAPLIASFARRVFYLGAAGRGHTAKLVVNLVLGLNRVVLSEGLGLAHRSGLDLAETLEILKASAARSEVMVGQGARMLSGDFDRPAARLAQHAKDVGLILALAAETGARVPASELHRTLLEEAIAAGWGGLDNAAVIKLFVPP